MGGGSWKPSDWKTYSTSTARKTTKEIFESDKLDRDLNPHGVHVRESRDSVGHPQSTAVITALDVTGSMGMIADNLARKGLGILMQEILDRKPVTDPHLMVMGVGDVECDRAPLQVSQFEADITITKWLEKIFLEHGGGGNNYESYTLPWYFASLHTSIDCFEKRSKKGFLFTVGDEEPNPILTKDSIYRFLGSSTQSNLSADTLLAMASRMYHVFHVTIAEGDHARKYPTQVKNAWMNLLGQHSLWLSDHTKLAETIVSAIQITNGADANAVSDSWDNSTALVVRDAVRGLQSVSSSKPLVRF